MSVHVQGGPLFTKQMHTHRHTKHKRPYFGGHTCKTRNGINEGAKSGMLYAVQADALSEVSVLP